MKIIKMRVVKMSVSKSEMRGKTIELNKSDAAVGVHELCEIPQHEEDVCWKKERNAKRIKKAAVFAVSVFVLAVTIISRKGEFSKIILKKKLPPLLSGIVYNSACMNKIMICQTAKNL